MDVEAYAAVQARVSDLLRGGGGEAPLAACPGWTVRDVTAHMAGLCQDWVAQQLDGYGSPIWTSAQVQRFAGRSLAEILGEWDSAMTAFRALPPDPVMGRPPADWAFADAVIHEADIRAALGASRVPEDAVALSLEAAIARWRKRLRSSGVPTLHLRTPDRREWWLGTPDDPVAVAVEVPSYELFRALAGRRSSDQVRAWDWEGDPGPYLAAGLPYPFCWAGSAIVD